MLGADEHLWPWQSLTVCKVSVGEAWSAVARGRGFELQLCHPVTLVTLMTLMTITAPPGNGQPREAAARTGCTSRRRARLCRGEAGYAGLGGRPARRLSKPPWPPPSCSLPDPQGPLFQGDVAAEKLQSQGKASWAFEPFLTWREDCFLLSLNVSKSAGRGFEPRGSRVLREPGEAGGRWLAPGLPGMNLLHPRTAGSRGESGLRVLRFVPRLQDPLDRRSRFTLDLFAAPALPESTGRRGGRAASSSEGGRLDSQERTAGIRARAMGERVGLLFCPATLSIVGHVQPGRGTCKILHKRGGGRDPVGECLKTGEGTVS